MSSHQPAGGPHDSADSAYLHATPPYTPASPPPQHASPAPYNIYAPRNPTYYEDNASPQLYARMSPPPAYAPSYRSATPPYPSSLDPHAHDPASTPYNPLHNSATSPYPLPHGSDAYQVQPPPHAGEGYYPRVDHPASQQSSARPSPGYSGPSPPQNYGSRPSQQAGSKPIYSPPDSSHPESGTASQGHTLKGSAASPENVKHFGSEKPASPGTPISASSVTPAGTAATTTPSKRRESPDENVGLYVCLGFLLTFVTSIFGLLLLCCPECVDMRGQRKAGFLIGGLAGIVVSSGISVFVYFYFFR